MVSATSHTGAVPSGFPISDDTRRGGQAAVVRPTLRIDCYQTRRRRALTMRSKKVKPHRVVRRRTKNWKMPANTVYVGRPTVWGNPFVVGSELIGGKKLTAEKSIALYRQYAREAFNDRDLRACLRGKNLACWCPLDQPCHADVLLEMANSA
jgi:hypothetical protein